MALLILSFAVMPSTASALNISYTATGANASQIAAFDEAAKRWEYWLKDPVTVKIDLFMSSTLPSNVLGSTNTASSYAYFVDVRQQLNLDKTSAADNTAVAYVNSLPTLNSKLVFASNDVYPNGADGLWYGSEWDIWGTNANLKALGYNNFTGSDATIEFNSNFAFDYNPSDGILSDSYDFVGIATHEIGHVLGFVSVVDDNAFYDELVFPPSILDLYRHTDVYGAAQIDTSFDGRDAYFSHDFGLTQIDFSGGEHGADGYQASHWQDNLHLGIMDPTAAKGELLTINGNDLLAFDVIGWNTPVPEPMSVLLLSSGLFFLGAIPKKKR